LKILILTQYYPPETGAPQNRLSSLAKYLALSGNEVSVLTAMPNYPKMEIQEGYKRRWFVKEEVDKITVYRSSIFVSKSKSISIRLLNYFSFMISSMFTGIFRVPRHDIIICESPPLFLGVSALILKWTRRSKLVFNVSDLWPESAAKLGLVNNRRLLALATRLEEFIYRKSDFISGQTKGIVNDIRQRIPGKKFHWLPNGVDFSFFNSGIDPTVWRKKNKIEDDEILVLYAGIIGHAQGLEVIVKAAGIVHNSKIKFFMVGDGPVKDSLITQSNSLGLSNITFLPNQPRELMPTVVSSCDIFIVPLKKLDIFKGAIPSKLFEPLAYKKPILLGVDGEARELFISEGRAGLYFEPEDSESLARCIVELANNIEKRKMLGEQGYHYVKEKFDRKVIAAEFNSFLHNNL
jgi:glycosyltransferase involved in cell wall biosynthesis